MGNGRGVIFSQRGDVGGEWRVARRLQRRRGQMVGGVCC
jgi:hypothetical protein